MCSVTVKNHGQIISSHNLLQTTGFSNISGVSSEENSPIKPKNPDVLKINGINALIIDINVLIIT